MPTFKYNAKDQNSRNLTGKITADSQMAVIEELRKRNLTIIGITEVKEVSWTKISVGGSVKEEDIVIFCRQLATMIEAGIPIIQALDALHEQTSNIFFKGIIVQVKQDVELGGSLSASFGKHTKVFDNLFINMVKVGETGGVLSAILDRISGYMEKTLNLKRKVKSALIYPAVVISMALVITGFLIVKVVPTFASIYKSLNSPLPAMTQSLIVVSEFSQKYILWIIPVLIVIGFVLGRMNRTEKGGYILDHAKLKMPVFGDLLRKVAISRFARTLGTLIQSGVPILESLEIVGKNCGNRVLEKVVEEVKGSVREGESIATPLGKATVFPPMVTRMIAVGEKSGQLEKMLFKIAEFYDDQVDAAVAGLTSIIEPVLMGFLGIVVGFIVIALFLPIINITRII